MKNTSFSKYIVPTEFINSAHPAVINYAQQHTVGITDPVEQIVELFYAVRDDFRYDIKDIGIEREELKASELPQRESGSCLEKSCLLAASYRAIGVPSRVGFLNIRSQFTSDILHKVLNSDVIVFQGYAQVWVENHWAYVNPAFDQHTAQKLNIKALDFGLTGREQVEVIKDFGVFADLPYTLYLQELQSNYPHLFTLPDTSPDDFLAYLDSLV